MLLNGKSIFIVEDNVQNRVVFQLTLIKHGARVDFERAGRDALARLGGARHVDIIILDLMLSGGLTGYDIFDEIRADERFDHVPIVAVSAADPSDAIPRTRAKGFSGFIAKPIDDVLFPKQIVRLLAGEAVWYAGEHYTGVEELTDPSNG